MEAPGFSKYATGNDVLEIWNDDNISFFSYIFSILDTIGLIATVTVVCGRGLGLPSFTLGPRLDDLALTAWTSQFMGKSVIFLTCWLHNFLRKLIQIGMT